MLYAADTLDGLLSTTCFLVRDGAIFLLREQMSHHIGLAPLLYIIIRGTHSLTEYVTLVSFKDLLVPQREQLSVSLGLHVFRIDSLVLRLL